MAESQSWVTVITYTSALEADMAVGLLMAAGIPAWARGNDIVGIFGPGFQGPTVQGVDVLVARASHEQAAQVLRDYESESEE